MITLSYPPLHPHTYPVYVLVYEYLSTYLSICPSIVSFIQQQMQFLIFLLI